MIPSGTQVAVTGATGFIGTALCQQLLADGYTVKALVRSPTWAHALMASGVSLIEGDLDDSAALAALMKNCAAIVHSAGAVRGNSQADFDHVNVTGTKNILDAVAAQPAPPKLLHLSSIVAREPDLSYYSLSKRTGEDLVTVDTRLDWTVIRPPAVYGAGDTEMLPIFKAMSRGIVTVPGSPDARTSLIAVSDVVAAIITCLSSAQARGGVFEIADPNRQGYSWSELAAIGADVFGRRVRVWPVPGPVLDLAAAINSRAARMTGRAPMLTPQKVRELRHPDWVADTGPITAATGWLPKVDFGHGLRELKRLGTI